MNKFFKQAEWKKYVAKNKLSLHEVSRKTAFGYTTLVAWDQKGIFPTLIKAVSFYVAFKKAYKSDFADVTFVAFWGIKVPK